ncbi:MAG: hypothetical protein GX785_10025 [Armatimonadetes bacterium]|nr:hypothetical protein [Armatimonadota bacterium]
MSQARMIASLAFAAFLTAGSWQLAQAETAPPPPPAEAEAEAETAGETSAPAQRGGRYLQLPDISFVGSAIGKLSDDDRDPDRNRLRLDEAEIGIQSYVYPHVRADAFLVAPGHEEFKLELEEGYLTFEQLPLRLTGHLGKFFVPFGRDNQKHPHSWLYVRRPLVWRNLVTHESLTGNGVVLSWLAPTRSRLFLQLDAGAYTEAGHSHSHGEDAHSEGEAHAHHAHSEIPEGAGANFSDKFYTGRLWSGLPIGARGELEFGGSWAHGTTEQIPLPSGALGSRSLQLTGLDVSYRAYGKEARRLLLRAEHLWHRYRSDLGREMTTGYYALVNYRWNKYNDFGVLYDWTEIPGLHGHHESALSAIFTRQFTEQTYARLQLTRGDRPGMRNYTEAWLQMVWGIGPHTHQLE